jgi:hypothetical protein
MNSNLFEQFAGADLNRLAECIKAIRKAGLSTSKYTQAGVNQSSGNVWVWDEDWAGCVACSIGFDVSWYHSCPECGEEHDFKIYLDLSDYIEKHDGQCESCKPKFVAGWNMPGYMPDSEPMEFDSATDALDYIKGEMRQDAEDNAPESELDELLGQIDTFKADKNGEFGAGFLAYHYFISRA